MNSDQLLLHPDVELLPVASLSPAMRANLDAEPDDFALTRIRSRRPSSIVDPATASFLAHFRAPNTLAAAALAEAASTGISAEHLLVEAREVLIAFIQQGILVPADDDLGDRPLLAAGDEYRGHEVLGLLQRMEDTELYLLERRGLAVLKVWKRCHSNDRAMFDLEVAALQDLEGTGIAPALFEHGEEDGLPFLVLEFLPGVEAETACSHWLRQGDLPALQDWAASLARQYAALHARGILHGDVHPNNILTGRDQGARLIDFGLARRWDDLRELPVGGVAFYYSPELAAAETTGEPFRPTVQSEQYSLAALVFRLLTGHHYCSFRLNRAALLEQVQLSPPATFEELGARPWPALEAVLRRALAKDPVDRFAGMAEFAIAIAAAHPPGPASGETGRSAALHSAAALLEKHRKWLQDAASPSSDWLPQGLPAPRSSVNFGAAGIAYGLLRIAAARDDGELLAGAALWAKRAEQWATGPEAFENPAMDLGEELIGRRSPFHRRSGVFAVQALVAASQALERQQGRALELFLAASQEPAAGADLTLGDAATVSASSLLLAGTSFAGLRKSLIELGDSALSAVWNVAKATGSPRKAKGDLGMAHGWAGYLFATLQWCRAAGRELPALTEEYLDELGGMGRPFGRSRRWPIRPAHSADGTGGWCHGSAGYVLLFSLAAEVTGKCSYSDLSEAAAWDCWDDGSEAASLCCGLVGRSYALLRQFRSSGDERWCRRAEELAVHAARHGQFGEAYRHSLFKGELGLAILAADIERPESAFFPFVESENWPCAARPRPSFG